ncbi:MAG: MarR family transcriptional regulator [Gammaproteobacteria bacterium]|nr:MarR family transcriptional regulator [Gammaproteobacteria bacterium]
MSPKNSKTFDQVADTIATDCLAVRVRLLNRTITAIYDDALRPLGLTAGQLNVLVVIANRGPVSPGDIARRLNMEKSTVSRNLARMRDNDWITVAAGESGQKQRLTLNRRGKALLERALPAWEDAQTQARALLGQRGADSIRSLGNTVWSRIGRD